MLRSADDLVVGGESGDAAAALDCLRNERFDLALIDLSLERGSGLDLIREIRIRHPEVKILVLSMHEEATFAERALRAGAHGYIHKSRPGDELLLAIRKVLRGELAVGGQVSDDLLKRALHGKSRECGGVASLSNRELEVFELIGKGLSTTGIAELLHISVKTVESHREHIKTKLGLEDSASLVRRAALWIESGS